jgi:translation initiation factor IF-3
VAHRAVVVVHHKARVAAVTVVNVTVQAAMAGVMIVRQALVVARLANLPVLIAVKRDQPVAAVLKVAVA